MSSRLRLLAVAVAVLVGLLGVWRAADSAPPTPDERAAALFESLRCPTCTAESIADSQAPLAASMRDTVREQIADGHTDEEIRDWFVTRYGTTVLLSPPIEGLGILLWGLPGLVVLLAVVRWRRRLRRRTDAREPSTPPPSGHADDAPVEVGAPPPSPSRPGGMSLLAVGSVAVVAAGTLVVVGSSGVGGSSAGRTSDDPVPAAAGASVEDSALAALRAATERSPREAGTWLALGRELDERGELEQAERAYRRALRIEPAQAATRFRLAFVMLRSDRPAAAARLLSTLVDDHPDNPEALLLLATAQRETGRDTAGATFERFLRVAPDHPAAPRVREMLEDGQDDR